MEPKPVSQPPHKQAEDETVVYNQEFGDLLSSLPKERVQNTYAYQYQGFWHLPRGLQGLVNFQKHFQPRTNDVFLVTSPKSGTTWFKAILYALLNREAYPPSDTHHPLLNKVPHDLVPFVEFLDPSMDIKDNFVSFFHFMNNNKYFTSPFSLEDAFNMYCKGTFPLNNWDQILGYWRESLEKPHKVLFMKYEEMKSEPQFQLSRLANFLGKPFSQEEENSGLVDDIINLCSFDTMSKLAVVSTENLVVGISNKYYFRNGVVGDGKKLLSADMASKLDHITEEKFRGSGLSL